MKYFEVGQKVWDFRYGDGMVSGDDILDGVHPIRVRFESHEQRYTTDGKHSLVSSYITLFQTAPIITPNVPIIEFEQGELVLVRDWGEWLVRYYSHFKNDKHWCFTNQLTKGFTTPWKEIVKITNNPLLPNT